MTIRYLDLENGNDANDGLSFANRKLTFTGINTNLASGDEVRIMASKSALIGTAKWTSPSSYADHNSTASISSITNTANATVTCSGRTFNEGDLIYLTSTGNNAMHTYWEVTSVISDSQFTINNPTAPGTNINTGLIYLMTHRAIKLTTPNVAMVANSDPWRTAWTASFGCTTTLTTSYTKGRGNLDQISVTGTTSGLYAYKTLDSSLDLSAYTHLTFCIMASNTTISGASGQWVIDLCSDTGGTVIVNSFSIPRLPVANNPLYLHLEAGAILGSNINSIALRRVSGSVVGNFYIGPVVATTQHGIGFNSIVGTSGNVPSSMNTNPWMSIGNVDFTGSWWLFEKGSTGMANTNWSTVYGPSGTIDTYIHNPIVIYSTSSAGVVTAVGGVNNVTYSGGWSRTDMSTQVSDTWISGASSTGYGLSINNLQQDFNNIGAHRYALGFYVNGKSNSTLNIMMLSCQNGIALQSGVDSQNLNLNVYDANCCVTGLYIATTVNSYNVFLNCNNAIGNTTGISISTANTIVEYVKNLCSNSTTGISMNSTFIKKADNINCNLTGITLASASNKHISNCSFNGNTNALNKSAAGLPSYIKNCTFDNIITLAAGTAYRDTHFINCTMNNVYDRSAALTKYIGDVVTWTDCNWDYPHGTVTGHGTFFAQTTTRHSLTGYAWEMDCSDSNPDSNYPLTMPLAKILCQANSSTTISVWLLRSTTNINAKLMCTGNQVSGIPNDVYTNMTADANTWEQVSITVTPTETSVIQIEIDAYGSADSVFVDDVTIS